MLTEQNLRIHERTYEWTGRALGLLERILKLNVKLHGRAGLLAEGEIFVFNHFARFETFIPQYLIHRETGALCRSVASGEFFRGEDALSRYLLQLGAVPNDYPALLPFLAAEVLRGRKVVIFPEGGMVKDRRVLDARGRYSIFSRTSLERRKHHTGAGVVGLAVASAKAAVAQAARRGDERALLGWVRRLGLPGPGALLEACARPTSIVPCNITFYPLRITENPLARLAGRVSDDLSPRALEELLIEGNLLLRDTDMDLRLGDAIHPDRAWAGWERWLLGRRLRGGVPWEEVFALGERPGDLAGRVLARRVRRRSLGVRDEYMKGTYALTTVNLSHLASRAIFRLLDRGDAAAGVSAFHRALYLAVKGAQTEPSLHLHRSLRNPESYGGLTDGHCPAWSQFLETARGARLVECEGGTYRFLPKLRQEHGFDEIRLENLVAVYANEVEPLSGVSRAVDGALAAEPGLDEKGLAELRFDDELRAYRWDWEAFHKPRHEAVNRDEGAREGGEPFLWRPERGGRTLGVLLVHGFTASPAEVRPLAERLRGLGYPCLGVRLKGHGTSPWDLRERTWEEWLDSVRRGYEILSAFAPRVCVAGFSAGGALALLWASRRPPGLAGAVGVCTPLLWRDRAMGLVSVVRGANALVGKLAPGKGLLPFYHAEPEHPEVNYLHKPIEALYELKELVRQMEEGLPRVRCPVLLVQATQDPAVDPESADLIYQGLGTGAKALVRVEAERHGILYEDTGETHGAVLDFLARQEER